MRRIVSLCLLVLLSVGYASAQSKTITVSGKVIEDDTKLGAVQASVQLLSLPDSTQAAGVLTNQEGLFTLPKVKPGKYVLKVSYVGFVTVKKPLQLTAQKTTNNVGVITLKTDAVMLGEAVVVASAPPVTVKGDTTEYSASAYRVAEGSMLEELVKKLPGVQVDDDGTITLNGKTIKKIMVDGKEFFSDDPQMSMKNLPADMVDKLKAYDKKSDQARYTGIDDGEEEPVLDLTIKKGMKKGWFGNLIGGYGSEERYEANVFASRFRDDTNIAIIAGANNTNNRGSSEFGESGPGWGGGRAGITTSQTLGVNFSKETKKLRVNGNVQYGHTNNVSESESNSERYWGGEKTTYEWSKSKSTRGRHDVRFDARLEWKPDTMTTILFHPRASYGHTSSSSESESESWSEEGGVKKYTNKIHTPLDMNHSTANNTSISGDIMVFRRLNSKGRNIFARGSFGYSDGTTDAFTGSTTEYPELEAVNGGDSILNIARYKRGDNDSRNWSVGVSYTEPLFNHNFLEVRYEFSHRKQTSTSLMYDDILNHPDYLNIGYVDSLSSQVANFYDTHTATLSWRGMYPKLMYSVGVGMTPQSSLSETTIGPNKDRQLPEQNVLNWAPSAMFRYRFSDHKFLMFRYSGRSQAPNIEDLQEVIDITSPTVKRYGNPNLKPSFRNNFSLFFNNFVPGSMRSISANIFFNNTMNAVTNKTTLINEQTNETRYDRVNVNGNWSTSGYFSFTTPLKNQKFTVSSNTNLSFNNSVGYTSVGSAKESVLSNTRNLVAGERLEGSYRTETFDVAVNGRVSYNLARNNEQTNSNRETFDYYVGGSTNITLPWTITLSTDINCRFKSGYTGDFNGSEVIWNAQIAKSFLKNNAATLRFKIYDILHQQSNLSRSISESMMSDTRTNSLGSYFMVYFTYKFNTLGGSRGKGGPRRGPGFGGPPGGPGMMRMHRMR